MIRWFFAGLFSLAATGLLAWFLTRGAGPSIDYLRWIARGQNWDYITLLGFLGLYFAAATYIWADIFSTWRSYRRSKSVFRLALRGIFYPAYYSVCVLAAALFVIAERFLFRYLHVDTRRIIIRAIATLTLIWISTFAILIFANLWPAHEKMACAWKFPKILSCVLTNYEGLAGGVIGAAGAVFAGWLAWIAVHVQIHSQKQKEQTLADAPDEISAAALGQWETVQEWAKRFLLAVAILLAIFASFLLLELVIPFFDGPVEIEEGSPAAPEIPAEEPSAKSEQK